MTTTDERSDERHPDTTREENLADTDGTGNEQLERSSAVATEERGDIARLEELEETDSGSARGSDTSPEAPLFLDDQRSAYRGRWDEIQTRFVDDPRQAVQDADGLVNTVVSDLESSFRTRREALEAGWQRGDDVSTEDLRLALQGYRSFFGRLLGD
jgi:hypothetical protein